MVPRTGERGGPQTRARIASVAAELFLERGFDAVTVADVARAAGVSSVTVFNHFPRKEDLYLDRADDAVELLRAAVRDRATGTDVLASLRATTMRLVQERHPLSGLDGESVSFFRTVEASPALVARSREIAADLRRVLVDELEQDPAYADPGSGSERSGGDPALLAALFVAGYASVLVATARRRVAGESVDAVVEDHHARFERLFEVLRRGL